jgi:hypothetical protein
MEILNGILAFVEIPRVDYDAVAVKSNVWCFRFAYASASVIRPILV